jgi:putative nucleotidyltransferase with HDIG domain
MQVPIENLENIIKRMMSPLEGTAHSYKHVERVLKIATFLASEEKADLELVQVGTILHDIGWTLGQPHNETGAKLASKVLEEIGYPQEKSEKVLRIILHHPFEFRDRLETLEEKIVWDADKIDLLGPVGITRAFHWGGKKPFETVVKYCFEEGLPIYGLLNTTTAKKIAGERHRRTVAFLSALEEELSTKDLGIG